MKNKLEETVCFSILKHLRTISYQNIYNNHVCHLKVVFILLLRNIFFCKYLFDLQTNFAGNKFSESLRYSIFIIVFFCSCNCYFDKHSENTHLFSCYNLYLHNMRVFIILVWIIILTLILFSFLFKSSS